MSGGLTRYCLLKGGHGGIASGKCYVASDVPAILSHTRQVYYIDDLEMACLEKGTATFYNLDGEVIQKDLVEIK